MMELINLLIKLREFHCEFFCHLIIYFQQEQEEEEIRGHVLHFYDNREAIDQLMGKTHGLFQLLDIASKELETDQYVLEKIKQRAKTVHIKSTGYHEFTIAHYTGKIIYDSSEMVEKNRDFVPPEMINTLRQSTNDDVKQMFINQLTKSGNLTIASGDSSVGQKKPPTKIRRGPMLLPQELPKIRVINFLFFFLK